MNNIVNQELEDVKIKKSGDHFDCTLIPLESDGEISLYRLDIKGDDDFIPQPVEIEWKVPAVGVKGYWRPTADFSKRIEADWELQSHESRVSIDAPVLQLFGNTDENIVCFSCSNAINRIEMAAKYREEDNHFYCRFVFFTECKYPIRNFSAEIRIDYRNIHFSQALRETTLWWENHEHLQPAFVPEIAKKPLYSTWYQFHQNLEEEVLIQECGLAKDLGFDAIIIDDGWQTKDNNRGYDYTGDWRPDRFNDMKRVVKSIQDLGVAVGLWYSVPFCGRKSEAYKKFKGKFLTENHRWAPVFDPRFPEVREYLVGIYVDAVRDWGLDGLKLDFIDDFKAYPDTSFEKNPNRDFASINDAVDQLLSEVSQELKKINPNIFIEFRQKYTGPAMRKYGNMLRAFDCPGDYVMNRVRIADIKMMSGTTAVHSDMIKWHFEEHVETAAIHYMNALFGVPQISIMLADAPEAHIEMVKFYTQYWKCRSEVLLSTNFIPSAPLSNYPILEASLAQVAVVGVFEDSFYTLSKGYNEIDILNAKFSKEIPILCQEDFGEYNCVFFDCKGTIISTEKLDFEKGMLTLSIPPGGMLAAQKI